MCIYTYIHNTCIYIYIYILYICCLHLTRISNRQTRNSKHLKSSLERNKNTYLTNYTYLYIYIYVYVCIYIYIYI